MPELPEVEVTRLGIQAHLEGRRISGLDVLDGRCPVVWLREQVCQNATCFVRQSFVFEASIVDNDVFVLAC